MKKLIIVCGLALPLALNAQFFTGNYVSEPQVEGFDRFYIKHNHGDEGRYEGVFSLKGFMGKYQMWVERAETIHGDEADKMIKEYGGGLDILSVHKMKMMWDGVEWEFFLLGYLDEKNHGAFVVVEELFTDETETTLLELNTFHWVKGKHASKATASAQ